MGTDETKACRTAQRCSMEIPADGDKPRYERFGAREEVQSLFIKTYQDLRHLLVSRGTATHPGDIQTSALRVTDEKNLLSF